MIKTHFCPQHQPLPSRFSSLRPCQQCWGLQGHPEVRCPPHHWGGLRWRWAVWWRLRQTWGGWGAGPPAWVAGGCAVGRWQSEAEWWWPAGGRVSWASAAVRLWRWDALALAPGGELWREVRAWLGPHRAARLTAKRMLGADGDLQRLACTEDTWAWTCFWQNPRNPFRSCKRPVCGHQNGDPHYWWFLPTAARGLVLYVSPHSEITHKSNWFF